MHRLPNRPKNWAFLAMDTPIRRTLYVRPIDVGQNDEPIIKRKFFDTYVRHPLLPHASPNPYQ